MADHVADIATSKLPLLGKDDFYNLIRGGDLIFCWGQEHISKVIENISGGPSHVLMVWTPWPGAPWLTLEATFPSHTQSKSGVHIGLFQDYMDSYPGYMILCRRPALTQANIQTELNQGFMLLDDNYNWRTEISIAARKLLPFLPPVEIKNEEYCSGLQETIARNTIPFKQYLPDPNTPEQDFIDPSVVAIARYKA
jgi:hypothetical protein